MSPATPPDFSRRLRALAAAPGVYLMRDSHGNVIYVGKAMRLRDRVRSYFQSTGMETPRPASWCGTSPISTSFVLTPRPKR